MSRRFGALPGPVRGVFWMLMQAAAMAALLTAGRQLTFVMPAAEAAFFRGFIGLLVMLPWLMRVRLSVLWPPQWRLVALRSALAALGIIWAFAALAGLSVSDVVAIQFTHPLFVIVGAALILREAVPPRRWAAVAVGFAGALLIIRPGFADVSILVLAALGSAICNSGVQLVTKHVSQQIPGAVLAFYMNLFLAPSALVVAWDGWVWPGLAELPWLVAVGLLGTLAHIFLTRAFKAADASLVGPVDFMRLPMAAAFGWLLFRELSDLWTWIGAAVIILAVLHIARRETRTRA